MDSPTLTFALGAFGFAALTLALFKVKAGLRLSRAKHPSLTGHPRMSRRIASLIRSMSTAPIDFFAPTERLTISRPAAAPPSHE